MTRTERRDVRTQLIRAGLLESDASATDAERVAMAVDLLRRALPRDSLRVAKSEIAEDIEQVKARLMTMKDRLEEESIRSRVAEESLRRALTLAAENLRERERLEDELSNQRRRSDSLERQVASLVDHENHLLRFTESVAKLEAWTEQSLVKLAGRVERLELTQADRTALERRAANQRLHRRRQLRFISGAAIWLLTAAGATWAIRRGVPHEFWAWIAFGAPCAAGAIGGSLMIFGRRRTSEWAGWALGLLDLLLGLLQLASSKR